jgi:N-acyl amino acid synthase FeeM
VRIPDFSPQHVRPVKHPFHPLWIDDLLQRLAAPDDSAEPPEVALRTRIAVAAEQCAAAEELVRRRYAWRGYRTPLAGERECAASHHAEHWVTILAEGSGKLVGTLTVGPDSPQGLLAEKTYAREIQSLRRNGSRLAELTRLALETGADWRLALDALVQAAWTVTRVVHALTDVVIEVNPRHVKFYERVFGFVEFASGRVCSRVGAPSVLLLLDLEDFGQRMQRARLAA